MPNDELFTLAARPVFDQALVEYADGWTGHVTLALRVARTVHVVVGTDVEEKEATEHIHQAGCGSRVEIALEPDGPAVYVAALEALDVVVTDPAGFEFFAEANDKRWAGKRERFNILLAPGTPCAVPDSQPQPFRLVSLGGTFNTFHNGHEQYFALALKLAARLHVYIATDDYAKGRKQYRPRTFAARKSKLARYLHRIGHRGRVTISMLKTPEDIGNFVRLTAELDLVLAERLYVPWFLKWNQDRAALGLQPCVIMCKPRGTTEQGVELASSLWEGEDKPPPLVTADMFESIS